MERNFCSKDIGKLVSLSLDVSLLNNDDFTEEKVNIPYEAIESYNYLIKTKSYPSKIIVNVGKNYQKKISPIEVARLMGANSVSMRGEIVDVGGDYLTIIPKKRHFP